MGALGCIKEIKTNQVIWGNKGDVQGSFKLLKNGEEVRKRLFNPNNYEVVDIPTIAGDTFTAQRETAIGSDLWVSDDTKTVPSTPTPPANPFDKIITFVKNNALVIVVVVVALVGLGWWFLRKKR